MALTPWEPQFERMENNIKEMMKILTAGTYNFAEQVYQQPPPTTTSVKPLRRISTLFLSNEAMSEASEAEDSVPHYQIPNPATSFKSLQRISMPLPDNLFTFEYLKAGGSADDSVPPQQSSTSMPV